MFRIKAVFTKFNDDHYLIVYSEHTISNLIKTLFSNKMNIVQCSINTLSCELSINQWLELKTHLEILDVKIEEYSWSKER